MENKLYTEWQLTLKEIRRNASLTEDFTKETKSTLRLCADTRFADTEKFRKGFNSVIRAAMKSFNGGTFYSCNLTRFTPYENGYGEYVRGEFREWYLDVSYLAANEIVFRGNCAADNVVLDAKNPYKDFAANF